MFYMFGKKIKINKYTVNKNIIYIRIYKKKKKNRRCGQNDTVKAKPSSRPCGDKMVKKESERENCHYIYEYTPCYIINYYKSYELWNTSENRMEIYYPIYLISPEIVISIYFTVKLRPLWKSHFEKRSPRTATIL